MAYPAVEAPYGLIPVNRLDGMPYAGAQRTFKVASGYATAMFNGDPVRLVADGVIERSSPGATVVTVGIFVGCSYTDPVLNYKLYSNFYPGGIAADDIECYVIDDDRALFKAAIVSSGTTIGEMDQTDVGANTALVDNSGNTTNGRSAVAVSETTASTGTLPVRVIGLVQETRNASGGFTEALVKWNAGHQYNNTTGV